MGYKSHPIGNATGMISLVSALVIEYGEKKIETERVMEAESKKLMSRSEKKRRARSARLKNGFTSMKIIVK